jgi:hypothetical protein
MGRLKPTGKKCSLYEGVVFVPSTPGSKLWSELQKSENKFTNVQKIKSVKFVERGGTIIRNILVKSNPFLTTHCGWEQCWPCNGPMSIPSEKPTISGGPSDSVENIIHSYVVHNFQEVFQRVGRGEVGKKSVKILKKPVLQLESQLKPRCGGDAGGGKTPFARRYGGKCYRIVAEE